MKKVIAKKRRIYPEEIDSEIYLKDPIPKKKFVRQARINMYEFTPSTISLEFQLKYTLRKLGFKTDSSGEFLGKISYYEDLENPNVRVYEQVIYKEPKQPDSLLKPPVIMRPLSKALPPFISRLP